MTTMHTITFTNNFHNTSAAVIIHLGTELSKAQIRRVRKALCPSKDCKCGGALGQRGKQEVAIEQLDVNRILINAKSY